MSQHSTAFRNAAAAEFEAQLGPSPILEFFTGAKPADCAAADTGTLIGEGTLPSDYLTTASNGAVTKNGTWSFVGLPAAGTGTDIGHYRMKDAAGTTCHSQGTVTVTGGGGDMTMDNINIANAQAGAVGTWSLTIGGA